MLVVTRGEEGATGGEGLKYGEAKLGVGWKSGWGCQPRQSFILERKTHFQLKKQPEKKETSMQKNYVVGRGKSRESRHTIWPPSSL